MAFDVHPTLHSGEEIQVVLYGDHFDNEESPYVTDAVFIVLESYPPPKYIGECYQNELSEWYYIADKDGVNLIGDIAYYL